MTAAIACQKCGQVWDGQTEGWMECIPQKPFWAAGPDDTIYRCPDCGPPKDGPWPEEDEH